MIWIQSYFTNRRQHAIVDAVRSSVRTIAYGVPQDGIISPLMFILYMNDIVRRSNVDDTNVFTISNDIRDMLNTMNVELTRVSKWFSAKKLALNTSKSTSKLFQREKHRVVIFNESITNVGHLISLVNYTKFLGEHLAYCLLFGLRCLNILTDPISYRSRNLFATECRKKLHNTIIYPVSNTLTVYGDHAINLRQGLGRYCRIEQSGLSVLLHHSNILSH